MSELYQSLLVQQTEPAVECHTLIGYCWVPTRSRGGVTDV